MLRIWSLAAVSLVLFSGCGSSREDNFAHNRRTASPASSSSQLASSSAVPAVPPGNRVALGDTISMEVPAGFVPMEAELSDKLRQSGLGAVPNATVTIDAKRAAGGMKDGAAFVIRSSSPIEAGLKRGTVLEFLESTAGEVELGQVLSGIKLRTFKTTAANDAIEVCTVGLMTRGTETVELHACFNAFIGPELATLTTIAANCLQPPGSKQCDGLLEKRKVTLEPRSAMNATLGPPLPQLDDIGDFAMGADRESFLQACSKRKLRPSDPKKQPAEVQKFLASGELAECGGLDKTFPWGPLLNASATFINGKAASLIFEVDRTQTDVTAAIDTRFGTEGFRTDDGSRFIWPGAKDYQPLSIRAAPATIQGAKSALIVTTRTLFDLRFPKAAN